MPENTLPFFWKKYMSEWPQIFPLMDSTSPIGLICDIMYSAMNRSMNLIQLMTIKRLFFVTKIRSATLATKIIKNQGFVLKTIVVNLVLISPYGSNDLAHSLHSFVRTSISVNFGNIFELRQKNACCINVLNQKMILIYHIGGQNQIRYLYSVFRILYAVRGVGA